MAKHDRRTSRRHPPTSRSVSIQVPLPVLAVLGDVRQAFRSGDIARCGHGGAVVGETVAIAVVSIRPPLCGRIARCSTRMPSPVR